MSAVAHALLSIMIGAASIEPPAATPRPVPPPRITAPTAVPMPAPVVRKPPPAPGSVALVAIGVLAVACGASLSAVGVQSRLSASTARTEGEATAHDASARSLLGTGLPLASAGLGLVAGGLVWLVRSRRRASHRE